MNIAIGARHDSTEVCAPGSDVVRDATRDTTSPPFQPGPTRKIEQLYWYTTGVVAAQLGIELHMMQLMSTHSHEVLSDPRGMLPRFFELRNRLFANALKALLGWPEEVFSRGAASWVELTTPEAMIKEMAYTAANCVTAGLVRTPRRWPGAKVLVEEWADASSRWSDRAGTSTLTTPAGQTKCASRSSCRKR